MTTKGREDDENIIQMRFSDYVCRRWMPEQDTNRPMLLELSIVQKARSVDSDENRVLPVQSVRSSLPDRRPNTFGVSACYHVRSIVVAVVDEDCLDADAMVVRRMCGLHW
jgi:hypothetical protein